MKEIYYRLELDDYAKPGFVSFSKYYFGTLNEIRMWLSAIEAEEDRSKNFQSLFEAYEAFLGGQTDVTHFVAYNNVPFLRRATVLYQEELELHDYQWEHTNIWGFPYYMRCKSVNTTHLWLRCDRKYYRYVYARFLNLEYAVKSGFWHELDGGYWGFPEVLTVRDGITRNRLAERESCFDSLTKLTSDWEAFKANPMPDFTEFCNDIFGDG